MNTKCLHILLADDDRGDCLFFKDAVERMPIYTALTAVHDSEQLMQQLKGANQLPDILFLDLNMHRKNGFECLSEIKGNKKLKDLPVVIFSTSYIPEVVNLLYRNGAQYLIRKPAQFTQFQKIIQHVLTITAEQNISKPVKADFVLTAENSLVI